MCVMKAAGRAIQAYTRIDHQAKRDLTQKSTKLSICGPATGAPNSPRGPNVPAAMEHVSRGPTAAPFILPGPQDARRRSAITADWTGCQERREEAGNAYRQTRLAVSMVGSLSRSVDASLFCFLYGLCSSSSSGRRPLFLQHPR